VKRAVPERFATLWRRCHPGPDALAPEPIYADVVACYGEPHRRYHTLGHVDDCLERFDGVHALPPDPGAVELALWFHDVIFDADARDNERRSAQYYLDRAAGTSPRFRRHVCSMILASNHASVLCNADLGYVLDIDLAGFGHPWPKFRRTTDTVRAEYTHLSDAQFAVGMAGFFTVLLSRPTIFRTASFRDRCEARARANIAALCAEWTDAGYLPRNV
jgi:predicted metal-dependent HD superfamily phosphohydrolase